MDLAQLLADHKLWLAGKGGARANLTRANLTDADLAGANLTDADLAGANFTRADLTRADLTRANLTRANLTRANLTDANITGANLRGADLTSTIGIRWAAIGPVGQGRRLLAAWAHDSLPEPIVTGGCFHGTFAEFRATIAGCPWGWGAGTESDRDRWRAECSEAADWLESKVA